MDLFCSTIEIGKQLWIQWRKSLTFDFEHKTSINICLSDIWKNTFRQSSKLIYSKTPKKINKPTEQSSIHHRSTFFVRSKIRLSRTSRNTINPTTVFNVTVERFEIFSNVKFFLFGLLKPKKTFVRLFSSFPVVFESMLFG